jgi:C4-dicarboxylate transporter, DctM subunit
LIFYQAKKGLLPKGEKRFTSLQVLKALKAALIPLLMPVIIFGGILGGVATATEVAVLAVIYAIIIGVLYYRENKWSDLPQQLINVVKITGSVMFLAGVSMVFSWILAAEHVPEFVSSLIKNMTKDPHVFLFISNMTFVFFTALMDGLPALLIFYPVLSPIAMDFGISALHFALLSIACCGIGLTIPPIGMLLIVVSGIGKIELSQVFRPMIPYVAILLVGLMFIIYIPWITLILPRLVFPQAGY